MTVSRKILLLFLVAGLLCARDFFLQAELEIPHGFHVAPRDIVLDEGWKILDDRNLSSKKNRISLQWQGEKEPPKSVRLTYQPCSDERCLLPIDAEFSTTPQEGVKITKSPEEPPSPSTEQQRTYGALSPQELLHWLQTENPSPSSPWEKLLHLGGLWLLLLIPLGLLLNLTPCVLPLIPINLAIIGATGEDRRKGLLRSSIYALGMALAYGFTGGIIVSSGGIIGSLQNNGWFHLAMGGLFLLLVCALCGWLPWNLQRLRHTPREKSFNYPALFLFGGSSALLAGTCTGPILAATLLFAAEHFNQGNQIIALLMPLLLGIGLALPWPFLGAGFLKILPRPGRWMKLIHLLFALLLLLFAARSLHLGFQILRPSQNSPRLSSLWLQDPALARQQSINSQKNLLIFFSGPACPACESLKKTLRNPQVEQFIFAHYIPLVLSIDQPEALALAKKYSVRGIPCLLIPVLEIY